VFKFITKEEIYHTGLSALFTTKVPDGLWYKGVLPFHPLVSIVGTRTPTRYAEEFAHLLALTLAQKNLGTVSGGAFGVDAAVHQGTLQAQGYTCVVLGCGINLVYPPVHKELFEQIIAQKGCILSTFPPDSAPRRNHFPSRNSIIAALGLVTVVIEGSLHSGTMHTAHAAQRMGKTVFALPGSSGTNALLQQGAKPILQPVDLLSFLQNNFFYNNIVSIDNQTAISTISNTLTSMFPLQQQLEPVDQIDKLSAVLDEVPRDPGELSAKADISLGKCVALLLWLEANRKCLRLPGDLYVALTINDGL